MMSDMTEEVNEVAAPVAAPDYADVATTDLIRVSHVLLAEFDIDKGSSVTCCQQWNGTAAVPFTGKVSQVFNVGRGREATCNHGC